MGRPPKAPAEAKSQVYQLRLTADERELWESAAERAGKTLSEWIRERLNRAAKRSRRTSETFWLPVKRSQSGTKRLEKSPQRCASTWRPLWDRLGDNPSPQPPGRGQSDASKRTTTTTLAHAIQAICFLQCNRWYLASRSLFHRA